MSVTTKLIKYSKARAESTSFQNVTGLLLIFIFYIPVVPKILIRDWTQCCKHEWKIYPPINSWSSALYNFEELFSIDEKLLFV